MTVINKEIHVKSIRVIGISSSSVLIVGDTQEVKCSSSFDTPSESLIIGPLVPLPAES